MQYKQVAQLSQRDRAAGWFSYGQEWKTVTGRQYFTDIIRNCDVLASKAIEFGEKNKYKGYYAVQGHRGRYQSEAGMRLPIIVINSN